MNLESGRIYSETLVEHYRVYRKKGVWLSGGAGERIGDAKGGTVLHAHSRDAAQQGFYIACKVAKANRGLGAKYPCRRKQFRTTIWKNTGIKKVGAGLRLALARGEKPVQVVLPKPLAAYPKEAYKEMRLVWDRAASHYHWHLVIEDGQEPGQIPGDRVAAVDLGEIHPAAATDGTEVVVFSARQLRSLSQYSNKRLAELQTKLSKKAKGSKRWRRIARRKTRFLAQQKRRKRDIEHKTSRALVAWAKERQVGTLAVGDVRDIAHHVDQGSKANQKIANWSHGRLRSYIEYKAQAAGIQMELVAEHYSSQTCPCCGHRQKPKGRLYACPVCGFRGHRDGMGATNLLSRFTTGEVGKLAYPTPTKYRHPYLTGKRSRDDTAHVARPYSREAAPL